MRDRTRLRAFELADQFALATYRATKAFPREEVFGLTAQMRRAAVSVASHIVEGRARQTEADDLRFLGVSFGTAKELGYQISLAHRLGHLKEAVHTSLHGTCDETSRMLNGLIRSLRS